MIGNIRINDSRKKSARKARKSTLLQPLNILALQERNCRSWTHTAVGTRWYETVHVVFLLLTDCWCGACVTTVGMYNNVLSFIIQQIKPVYLFFIIFNSLKLIVYSLSLWWAVCEEIKRIKMVAWWWGHRALSESLGAFTATHRLRPLKLSTNFREWPLTFTVTLVLTGPCTPKSALETLQTALKASVASPNSAVNSRGCCWETWFYRLQLFAVNGFSAK